MKELFRDTLPGHLLRIVSRGKILPFEEDENPETWSRYVHKEKSGHLAHHGTVEPLDDYEGYSNDNTASPNRQSSGGSSGTMVDSRDQRINENSGVKVDPESGKDVALVHWYSEDDPEVWIERHSFLILSYFFLEPAKLVILQEVLRHIPDLLHDIFNLYWISYIFSRNNGRHGTIRC